MQGIATVELKNGSRTRNGRLPPGACPRFMATEFVTRFHRSPHKSDSRERTVPQKSRKILDFLRNDSGL